MLEDKKHTRKAGEKKKKIEKEVKIQDLLSLLEGIQKLAKNSLFGRNINNSHLNQLLDMFEPIKGMSIGEFVEVMSKALDKGDFESNEQINSIQISDYSNSDIRNMCINSEKISKTLLETIGHEKFGISQALLKANNKEKVIQLILSSLDNLEILDSIANKAKQ